MANEGVLLLSEVVRDGGEGFSVGDVTQSPEASSSAPASSAPSSLRIDGSRAEAISSSSSREVCRRRMISRASTLAMSVAIASAPEPLDGGGGGGPIDLRPPAAPPSE